jgi:hypothetical protein
MMSSRVLPVYTSCMKKSLTIGTIAGLLYFLLAYAPLSFCSFTGLGMTTENGVSYCKPNILQRFVDGVSQHIASKYLTGTRLYPYVIGSNYMMLYQTLLVIAACSVISLFFVILLKIFRE